MLKNSTSRIINILQHLPSLDHIPAVTLSPNAITTFISCGLSSYTFCADLVKGGRLGQLNSSANEEDKQKSTKPTGKKAISQIELLVVVNDNQLI